MEDFEKEEQQEIRKTTKIVTDALLLVGIDFNLTTEVEGKHIETIIEIKQSGKIVAKIRCMEINARFEEQ